MFACIFHGLIHVKSNSSHITFQKLPKKHGISWRVYLIRADGMENRFLVFQNRL